MGQQQVKTYTSGFHVLHVTPNSPGEQAGIVSFFDFIVAANGVLLEKDGLFAEILKDNVEKSVEIYIYNSKEDNVRVSSVVPRTGWGGKGLLGLSIRFCSNLKSTTSQVWHILDVYPNSPASGAGLISNTDYVIGTPELVSTEEQEDLFTLIAQRNGQPIKLYIYNSESEEIRLVEITPNKNWGGEGSLGCDIGYGLLHRVPRSTDGVVKKTVVKIPQEHLQPNIIHSVSPSQTQPTELSSSASVTVNTVSIPPSGSTNNPPVTLMHPPAPSALSDIPSTANIPLVSYAIPSTSNATTIFTPAAPFTPSTLFSSTSAPSIAQPEAPTPLTSIPPTLPSLLPAAPSAVTTTTTTPALSSVEALQKQLEALRVQNQKIQEMRSKQMAAAGSSSSGLPTSTSSPSVGQPTSAVPQITAQALAALKIQALAAKQQQ